VEEKGHCRGVRISESNGMRMGRYTSLLNTLDGSIRYGTINVLGGLLGRVEDRSSEGRGGEEAGLACQWQDSGACERHVDIESSSFSPVGIEPEVFVSVRRSLCLEEHSTASFAKFLAVALTSWGSRQGEATDQLKVYIGPLSLRIIRGKQ